MNERSCVSVVRVSPSDVHAGVRRAMELADWKRFVPAGADVSIKVNLGWDILIPGSTSAPWVVEGVIRTIQPHVGRIYLVESDQSVVDAEKALRMTRLDRLCSSGGVEWVNMSKGRYVEVVDDNRLILKRVSIPEILTRTRVITLPVMKAHNKSVITGAVKNQWGCLQTLRHNYHPVLSQALVDINTLVRPCFAVMDGTVALEGNGPKSGRPKEMNLVLASGDCVALDVTAARVMGFDPAAIEHLQLCAKHGLGVADLARIDLAGEPLEDVKATFVPARHNFVSWGEALLRKSFVRRLVFDTFLFRVFCWTARRYYNLWDLCVGRKVRRNFMKSSPYAPQWK